MRATHTQLPLHPLFTHMCHVHVPWTSGCSLHMHASTLASVLNLRGMLLRDAFAHTPPTPMSSRTRRMCLTRTRALHALSRWAVGGFSDLFPKCVPPSPPPPSPTPPPSPPYCVPVDGLVSISMAEAQTVWSNLGFQGGKDGTEHDGTATTAFPPTMRFTNVGSFQDTTGAQITVDLDVANISSYMSFTSKFNGIKDQTFGVINLMSPPEDTTDGVTSVHLRFTFLDHATAKVQMLASPLSCVPSLASLSPAFPHHALALVNFIYGLGPAASLNLWTLLPPHLRACNDWVGFSSRRSPFNFHARTFLSSTSTAPYGRKTSASGQKAR